MTDINIYLHIPYCHAKCRYCNFFVVAGRKPHLNLYFKALKKELERYKDNLDKHFIKTIHFGGGTPSLVDPENIFDILKYLRKSFRIRRNVEIALEANPEDLSKEKLQKYKHIGINRLSIGLQAWQNPILSSLGRLYRIEDFINAYHKARVIGFKNINIDLIFGIPGQTIQEWEETLDNVIKLRPEHISCYSLEVDEESIFGKLEKMGKFKKADENFDRKMYRTAIKKLERAGYNHYEISNFAKPGFESKHNSAVWNCEEYIGIGAAAHSYFGKQRSSNVSNIEKYVSKVFLNQSVKDEIQKIDKNRGMIEYIILHLRLIKGIDLKEFSRRFKFDFREVYSAEMKKLQTKKLITVTKENLYLTLKGMDLENVVSKEFIKDNIKC